MRAIRLAPPSCCCISGKASGSWARSSDDPLPSRVLDVVKGPLVADDLAFQEACASFRPERDDQDVVDLHPPVLGLGVLPEPLQRVAGEPDVEQGAVAGIEPVDAGDRAIPVRRERGAGCWRGQLLDTTNPEPPPRRVADGDLVLVLVHGGDQRSSPLALWVSAWSISQRFTR